jgi:hypothetical protein
LRQDGRLTSPGRAHDITDFWLAERWLYLAPVSDWFTRFVGSYAPPGQFLLPRLGVLGMIAVLFPYLPRLDGCFSPLAHVPTWWRGGDAL